MSDTLTLLGTGTCELRPDRMATSALLSFGGLNILHDCGRGTCHRLAELGIQQNDLNHIVLSHFHPDHVSDLIPFLQAAAWSRVDPRKGDLHIYGPYGVRVQVMRILSLFGPEDLKQDHYEIFIHELAAGCFDIEGHEFELVSLPPAGNHGIRFIMAGKRIGLTGDSSYHEAEVEFLRGLDIAVIDSGHISDDQIVSLAASARPERLICSHVYRELDIDQLRARCKEQGFFGTIEVAQDLMRLLP